MSLDKEDDGGGKIIDCISSEENLEDDYLIKEDTLKLRSVLRKLTCEEIKILKYAYGKKGLKAYSVEVGASYYKVRKRKEEILKKLKFYIQ